VTRCTLPLRVSLPYLLRPAFNIIPPAREVQLLDTQTLYFRAAGPRILTEISPTSARRQDYAGKLAAGCLLLAACLLARSWV
jgi:hypothetical protein